MKNAVGAAVQKKKGDFSYPAVSQNYPTIMPCNEKFKVHFFLEQLHSLHFFTKIIKIKA